MSFETRFTWKKLEAELEVLNNEAPGSILPLLIGIDWLMDPERPLQSTYRQLSFWAYTLVSRTQDLEEVDRLRLLNHYFFDELGFQITGYQLETSDSSHFDTPELLAQKRGHSSLVGLVYLHLAGHLELPVSMVDTPQRCLLKWVRSGRSSFLDLSQRGKILSETELVRLFNLWSQEQTPPGQLEVLSTKNIFKEHIGHLVDVFEQQQDAGKLKICLDILLRMDPSDLKALRQRALLLRQAGDYRQALVDIKRYFSFVNKQEAPHELKVAYYELQALHKMKADRPTLLH